MTTLPILALAGYFLLLFEFIAMRHRVICAESDRLIHSANTDRICKADNDNLCEIGEAIDAQELYWNRGTK